MRKLYACLALSVLLAAGCGGGGGGAAPGEVVLEFKAADNQELLYKTNGNIDTNVEGQTRTWMSETRAGIKVVEIREDGTIVRSVTYQDFTMGELTGTGTLVPNPRAGDFVGESLQLTLDAEGKIVDWKGLDGISAMTDEGNALKDFMVQQLTEAFQPFPDGPLSVGSQWQRVFEIRIPVGGADLDNKVQIDYELAGFGRKGGRDCARIKARVAETGTAAGRRMRGKFWVDSAGEGTAEIWFDYNQGVIVEFEKRMTITRNYRYERAGEEDVASQVTSVAREFKMKLES